MIRLNYNGSERDPRFLWGETYQYLGTIKNKTYVFDNLIETGWDSYSTFDMKLGAMLYFAAVYDHLVLGEIVCIDDLKKSRTVKDVLSVAKEICKERKLPWNDFDFEGLTVKKLDERCWKKAPPGIRKIVRENKIMWLGQPVVDWNSATDFLRKFRYYDILSTDKVGIVITGKDLYD